MALTDIRLGYKNAAWFAAHPTLILKQGQAAFLEQTGTFKLGDGVTGLSALSFLGSAGDSSVWGAITGDINDQTDLITYVENGLTNLSGYIQFTSQVTSSATPTPQVQASSNTFRLTALAVNAVFGQPFGSMSDGNKLLIQIQDNGVARLLSFNTTYYKFSSIVAPTTTTPGKILTIEFVANVTDSTWECILCTTSSGTPTLTSTYVGYGDGSNLLTGNSNFAYASSKLTIQRSTAGGAIMATNNSYNLNGDAPIVIQDGSGYSISFGYTTTASAAYMYAVGSGLFINASYAIGALKYGVFLESGTGLSVSGKTRMGDSNFNTGLSLEVAGIMGVSTGIYAGGITTPTAKIHVSAGTTTAGTAPIKLTTGTAMTTPEDGAIEYHGSHLYFTIGSTRKQLDGVEIINGDPGRINVSGTSSISISLDGTFVGSIGYLASNNTWTGTNTFNHIVTFGGTNAINIGARNITLDTTTGTQIGTGASQKLAFYGTTPRVQPTSAITGPGVTLVGGIPINTLDTVNGYTFDKLVAALQSTGIIA